MLEWRINKQGGGERVSKGERRRVDGAGVGGLESRMLKELVFASLFRVSLLGFCPAVIVLCVLCFFLKNNLSLHRRI